MNLQLAELKSKAFDFDRKGTVGKSIADKDAIDRDDEYPLMFKLDSEAKKVPGSFPTATNTKQDESVKSLTTSTTTTKKGDAVLDKRKKFELEGDRLFGYKRDKSVQPRSMPVGTVKDAPSKYLPHRDGHLRMTKPLESAQKAPNLKQLSLGGHSSGTATSHIDNEPFGLASRWTSEERIRKKEVRMGLAEDGDGEEWIVV